MKHAFCIIAHKNVDQINTLLCLLDHPKTNIYLHLDIKSRIRVSDIVTTKYSSLVFCNRHDVRWGDISLVEAELDLFKSVLNSRINYDRVHLISAQDMPMKSIDYILQYFDNEKNKNQEFIEISEPWDIRRLKYYWFCTRHMRYGIVYKIVRHSMLLLQKLLRVNRLKKLQIEFKMGSEWVSLTLGAVSYLVQQYPQYQRVFRYSVCADEVYKQMLIGGGQV